MMLSSLEVTQARRTAGRLCYFGPIKHVIVDSERRRNGFHVHNMAKSRAASVGRSAP